LQDLSQALNEMDPASRWAAVRGPVLGRRTSFT